MIISINLANASQNITNIEQQKKEWKITPLKQSIFYIPKLINTLNKQVLF